MPSVGVVGRGVVGQRISRRLPTVLDGVTIFDHDPRVGHPLRSDVDVVVLAHGGAHAAVAQTMIERGVAVISVSDDLDDVRALLDLDDAARAAGVPLVVGAGMAPGLTELLARMLVSQMAGFDEIHLAIHGTAGPACARRHHRALAGGRSGCTTGPGSNARQGRDASCRSSPNRWDPTTAIAPSSRRRC